LGACCRRGGGGKRERARGASANARAGQARRARPGAASPHTGQRSQGMPKSRRIEYAGSVHDEREIEAVLAVLRGGPTALRIGPNVRAMEARGAELFGKFSGVMCNSGSSALHLAGGAPGTAPR